MPRYFFNVQDGFSTLDETGIELAGPKEARVEALGMSGDLLKTGVSPAIWEGMLWRLWVSTGPSGAGETLFSLRFSAVHGG